MSSAKKAKIGVLGASGYTGAELVRLLLCHPHAEIKLLTADRRAGKTMADVFAQFAPFALPTLTSVEDADWPALTLDVAFCALPHGTTQKVIKELLARAPRTKEEQEVRGFLDSQSALIAARLEKHENVTLPSNLPAGEKPERVAAFADFCHALMNSNEFLYMN